MQSWVEASGFPFTIVTSEPFLEQILDKEVITIEEVAEELPEEPDLAETEIPVEQERYKHHHRPRSGKKGSSGSKKAVKKAVKKASKKPAKSRASEIGTAEISQKTVVKAEPFGTHQSQQAALVEWEKVFGKPFYEALDSIHKDTLTLSQKLMVYMNYRFVIEDRNKFLDRALVHVNALTDEASLIDHFSELWRQTHRKKRASSPTQTRVLSEGYHKIMDVLDRASDTLQKWWDLENTSWAPLFIGISPVDFPNVKVVIKGQAPEVIKLCQFGVILMLKDVSLQLNTLIQVLENNKVQTYIPMLKAMLTTPQGHMSKAYDRLSYILLAQYMKHANSSAGAREKSLQQWQCSENDDLIDFALGSSLNLDEGNRLYEDFLISVTTILKRTVEEIFSFSARQTIELERRMAESRSELDTLSLVDKYTGSSGLTDQLRKDIREKHLHETHDFFLETLMTARTITEEG